MFGFLGFGDDDTDDLDFESFEKFRAKPKTKPTTPKKSDDQFRAERRMKERMKQAALLEAEEVEE